MHRIRHHLASKAFFFQFSVDYEITLTLNLLDQSIAYPTMVEFLNVQFVQIQQLFT